LRHLRFPTALETAMATLFGRLAKRARNMAATASYQAALEAVALQYRVPVAELRRHGGRRPGLKGLRCQALYLAVMHGHSRRWIAEVSGLSPEAVARACRAIEDARDDQDLDRVLDELELRMSG
jgi:hypothetical protein